MPKFVTSRSNIGSGPARRYRLGAVEESPGNAERRTP